VTPGPVASTTPDKSDPNINGSGELTTILRFAKESIPRPNPGSRHSHQDLPFVWRWRRHIVNSDYVGRTEFVNSCCFHFFFSSQSKFLRIRMEMMVVSYCLDLGQA
jgi:hypothetical protein